MNKIALFFDIDGTLFSETLRQVPQTAVLALKKTRERGNLVFINTGRTWCQTEEIRNLVENDGMLCGCGTYITAGGRVIYDRRIAPRRAEEIKGAIRRFGFDAVLEGVDGCYFCEGGPVMEMTRQFQRNHRERGVYSPDGWEDPTREISKFCVVADENSDRRGLFAALPDFDIIDRGQNFYECVPAGHSKASAIEVILKEYGLKKGDAWVFGDSMNDLSMFAYAENAVLMGKHDRGLEPYATFTTRTVEEDGIAYALETLGLL